MKPLGPRSPKTTNNTPLKQKTSLKKTSGGRIAKPTTAKTRIPKHYNKENIQTPSLMKRDTKIHSQPSFLRSSISDFKELTVLKNPITIMEGRTLESATYLENKCFNKDLEKSGDTRKPNDVLLNEYSINEITKTRNKIAPKIGNRSIRTLCLIDIQNTFTNGNLCVPGAEGKVFNNIQELIAHNKTLSTEDKLFDVIVMSKDKHPDNHISFTSRYFHKPEMQQDGSCLLKLTDEGKNLGIQLKDDLIKGISSHANEMIYS